MNFEFVLETGKQGLPTITAIGPVRRYLHSLYDPFSEAKKIVDEWGVDETQTRLYVVGLGLGYHIAEVLKRCPHVIITVLESYSEIVSLCERVNPHILSDSRVVIMNPDSESKYREILGRWDPNLLRFHPPSVECLPYSEVRQLISEMRVLVSNTKRITSELFNNWNVNVTEVTPMSVLTGKQGIWSGRPGLLIAAGPSLASNLPVVKELCSSGAVSLAVTRVFKMLYDYGVPPTALVATESNAVLATHFTHLERNCELPPLLALPTVHPDVVGNYPGLTRWVLQYGFEPAEEFARVNGMDLFHTGGSVATLALQLLHYFGCDPIIFVGQDLAYVNNLAHVDSESHLQLRPNRESGHHVQVMAVDGQQISSTTSWNLFRKWIERFIAAHPERMYVNLSQGAHIGGTTVSTPRSLMEQLSQGRKFSPPVDLQTLVSP